MHTVIFLSVNLSIYFYLKSPPLSIYFLSNYLTCERPLILSSSAAARKFWRSSWLTFTSPLYMKFRIDNMSGWRILEQEALDNKSPPIGAWKWKTFRVLLGNDRPTDKCSHRSVGWVTSFAFLENSDWLTDRSTNKPTDGRERVHREVTLPITSYNMHIYNDTSEFQFLVCQKCDQPALV